MGLIAQEVTRISLGTAVTPTYPRHPTAMAQQALTTAAFSSNRFTLGIGLSHKKIIEDFLGFSFNNPVDHMREYLGILMPLARGEQVSFSGSEYNVRNFRLNIPGVKPMPVVLGALGSKMLEIAGELTDGTNTWMVGPKTMRDHIVPGLKNQKSRVIGGVPIVLTNKVEEAKEQISKILKGYGKVPIKSNVRHGKRCRPADVASVGNEITLREEIFKYKEAGVTEFNAYIMHTDKGATERTLQFLSDFRREAAV